MKRKTPPQPTDQKKKRDETNRYDKVVKEALRHALPALLTQVLKVPAAESFEPLHIELHRTVERRADFLGQVYAVGQSKKIVHFELQAKDEHDMIGRMYLYSGLILVNYLEWDLEQVVLCLSEKRPTMPTELEKTRLHYGFRLIWIKDISYREFLQTRQPELMLLGILAGFEERSAEEVMEEVVNQVRQTAKSSLGFQRHTEQLHILSNLHNLQQIFEKVMFNISELIDETKDPFFQRGEKLGIEKGIEKGLEKGIEKGIEKGKFIGMTEKTLDIAANLILRSDHDDAFIASITGLETSVVTQIRDLLARYPTDFKDRLGDIRIKLAH